MGKAQESEKSEKKRESENKKEAIKAPEKKDDLKKIKGIGKVYEEILNREGIFTYEQVANMSEEQIEMMETKYSFKGDFKESVAHAKEIINGNGKEA